MAAPGAPLNRGALLRGVAQLSTEILHNYSRHKDATERLTKETATKTDLLARIAEADAELAVLEAQKKFESENDTELSSLQVQIALTRSDSPRTPHCSWGICTNHIATSGTWCLSRGPYLSLLEPSLSLADPRLSLAVCHSERTGQ